MSTYTTTSTTGMPGFVQPYAAGFLQRAQQVADNPYQAFQGQRVADLNPYQMGAYQGMANRAMQGSPVMSAANQQMQATISGQNLGGNPYLQSQIDATQQDMARNWNEVARPSWATANQRSGSFGNAGLAMAENRAFSDAQRNAMQTAANMRFQNYGMERQNQMQAMGMAPQFAQQDYADLDRLQFAGNQIQQQNQRYLDDSYQRFLEARNYPREQLGVMRDALGGLNFGSQTSQTQPGPSTASQLVGGALTGASLYNLLFPQPKV